MTSAFEGWAPPDGGVGLLFAATAWHWVDPDRRAALAARALAPGGTLALIGRRTQCRNAQIDEAFHRFGPHTGDRAPLPEWALPELRAIATLTDLTTWETAEDSSLPTEAYLQRVQTLSPFRRRTPENQRDLLAELRRRIDASGGAVDLCAVTSLVLARRVH